MYEGKPTEQTVMGSTFIFLAILRNAVVKLALFILMSLSWIWSGKWYFASWHFRRCEERRQTLKKVCVSQMDFLLSVYLLYVLLITYCIIRVGEAFVLPLTLLGR